VGIAGLDLVTIATLVLLGLAGIGALVIILGALKEWWDAPAFRVRFEDGKKWRGVYPGRDASIPLSFTYRGGRPALVQSATLSGPVQTAPQSVSIQDDPPQTFDFSKMPGALVSNFWTVPLLESFYIERGKKIRATVVIQTPPYPSNIELSVAFNVDGERPYICPIQLRVASK